MTERLNEALLDKALLEELYVRRNLTADEVARAVGYRRGKSVLDALRRHGIPARRAVVRGGRWDHLLTEEVLEELYVRQRLTARAVAARLGVPSAEPVRRALRRHGLAVRPGGVRPAADGEELTKEVLEELYLARRMTTAEIAGALGSRNDGKVLRALRRHGVPVRRPGGRSGGRWDGVVTKEVLEDLYVGQGLSAQAVADRLGLPNHGVVARALRRHGVPARPRAYRARTELARELLEELYVDRGLTLCQIGDLVGRDKGVVRFRAHEQAVPVRSGSLPREPRSATVVLEELHADPRVAAALRRHGVARRPLPLGPADRPLQSPRLDPALLRTLYTDLGLSAFKIELLTGASKFSVLARLRAAGVPVRPGAGGRRRGGS